MEETASPNVSNAAQKMKEGAVELKSAVLETGADILEKACVETESFIKANPYRAVLIAFGVGALAGLLICRR